MTMAVKILAFPKDKNPYQELLYSSLKKIGVDSKYITFTTNSYSLNLLEIFPRICIARLQGFNVFHLHWLYVFQVPINHWLLRNFIVRSFFSLYFLSLILWIKILGYKLIWTVHNVLPHEQIFVNDLKVTQMLASLCNAKIVHAQQTLERMKTLHISTESTFVIPHGNFRNVYKDKIKRNEARNILDINQDATVFLFFGMIRPYKGLEKLINTFKELEDEYKDVQLLIAGEIINSEFGNEVKEMIGENVNIKLNLKHIPSEKVHLYFSAADLAVLPYINVTTSGSAILSLGYNIPIIAPLIGDFTDLLQDVGYFYSPEDRDGLKKACIKALKERDSLSSKEESTEKYIQSISWEKIADATKKMLETL